MEWVEIGRHSEHTHSLTELTAYKTSHDVHVLKVDEVVDFDFACFICLFAAVVSLPSTPYVHTHTHSVRQLNALHYVFCVFVFVFSFFFFAC